MGHNLLTCIFANAMQQSSSIATATGTQIWPYQKTVKGHPSLIILTNLIDLESTKIQPQSFLSSGEDFKEVLLHMGTATILFNDAEPFEQSLNIHSTEDPMCNLVKIGQVVLEKTFTDFKVLYLYIAQGQGQITPSG